MRLLHDRERRLCIAMTAALLSATLLLESTTAKEKDKARSAKRSADPHEHFNSLASHPNKHATFSLRSQSEINTITHARLRDKDNPYVRYDMDMNGARVIVPPNKASLPSKYQLRPRFPLIDGTFKEVSIQWEVKWSTGYLRDRGGLNTHKAFQIARRGRGDNRRIEFQMRYSKTDPTAIALPTIRVYGVTRQDGRSTDPIADSDNWQPGGDTSANRRATYGASHHVASRTSPFVIRPDVWVRITASITFTKGGQRLRVWMSDEDTPNVLVIANPRDPNIGFLVDMPTSKVGFDWFWIEFNSSQSRTSRQELHAWVRNVVVFKNATVPLGGRPVSSSRGDAGLRKGPEKKRIR